MLSTEIDYTEVAHRCLITEKSQNEKPAVAKMSVVDSQPALVNYREAEVTSKERMPSALRTSVQVEACDTEYDLCGKYEEMTEKHLKEISSKLCHIKLYWSQQIVADVDQYVCNFTYSSSYVFPGLDLYTVQR
jgi:hypothetical protein